MEQVLDAHRARYAHRESGDRDHVRHELLLPDVVDDLAIGTLQVQNCFAFLDREVVRGAKIHTKKRN